MLGKGGNWYSGLDPQIPEHQNSNGLLSVLLCVTDFLGLI